MTGEQNNLLLFRRQVKLVIRFAAIFDNQDKLEIVFFFVSVRVSGSPASIRSSSIGRTYVGPMIDWTPKLLTDSGRGGEGGRACVCPATSRILFCFVVIHISRSRSRQYKAQMYAYVRIQELDSFLFTAECCSRKGNGRREDALLKNPTQSC